MDDTRLLFAETCIYGLKKLVLDTLLEAKDEWLGPTEVRQKSKIDDQFTDKEARSFLTPFTRVILCELRGEGLVVSEKRDPLKAGKPTLFWQLDKEEYHKRFSS
jgi:hypothetical protein